MYCSKCHKQSPENFVNCAYCGAKLNSGKKKQPSVFVKNPKIKLNFSFKALVGGLMVFAILLTIGAIFSATVTGSKPEKVIKNFTKSIQTQDEKLYYSLYDEGIKEYKKQNRYYGDEETFKNIVLPMLESDEFYKSKCGGSYKLSYTVKSSQTLPDEELAAFVKMLESNFSYIKMPSRVDILNVEVVAQGEKGEYKSIYNDFWCMKIKGRWYKVDKIVYTEYEKLKTTS